MTKEALATRFSLSVEPFNISERNVIRVVYDGMTAYTEWIFAYPPRYQLAGVASGSYSRTSLHAYSAHRVELVTACVNELSLRETTEVVMQSAQLELSRAALYKRSAEAYAESLRIIHRL
jgi:hypothetical protein